MAEEVREHVEVAAVSSPPPVPVTVVVEADPRDRLLELVRELRHVQSRRLLAEYMSLRRRVA